MTASTKKPAALRENKKKVKNVINGYKSCWGEIEELTIIEDNEDRVIFSGIPMQFLNPTNTFLIKESERIKEQITVRVLTFNDKKLFIFI